MSKKVLVVDDSEIVLEKAKDVLAENGYEVVTAMSALDADRFIYVEDKPDVIIMDVMMPNLDGDRKTRMLKDDASTRSIPVLLLSSKTERDLAQLVAESGADGYIRKPFSCREMIAGIESVS